MVFGDELPWCALWILRVLAFLSRTQSMRLGMRYLDDSICRAAGLPRWERDDTQRFDRIRERLEAMERRPLARKGFLFSCAEQLGAALGLDAFERELLALALAQDVFPAVGEAFEASGALPLWERQQLVATTMAVDADRVRRALAADSTLAESRLVRWSKSSSGAPFAVSSMLISAVNRYEPGGASLLDALLCPLSEPQLKLADYPHLARDIHRLSRLLRAALDTDAAGVDLLLHGPAGTGKTQLARLLAAQVGAQAYEVPVCDEDGDPHRDRFDAWALCQRVLARSERALVVFDEAEDAFPDHGPLAPKSGPTKGWVTRQLQSHSVPTIWIANRISHLDRAYLRRFDIVLEMATPPRRVRLRMLQRHLADIHLPVSVHEHLAADARLVPAHLGSAARVLELVGPGDPSDAEETLEAALRPQLDFLGRPPQPPYSAALSWDARIPRTSHDLEDLERGLIRTKRGTICLYGPPGTGKTAWAHHLARSCDRPLNVHGASDLLSCWLGETEKNLAKAFRSATEDEAILLLDEADSLLRDRSTALRSWEVTQVNELLVQLERFRGIVLCATNRIEDLDRAALRRFAVKIRFAPPGRRGRRLLVLRALERLAAPVPSDDALRVLDSLDGITPGSVTAAFKQLELLGEGSFEALVELLTQDRSLKRRRQVGFR